ncbi:MAG: 1-acyl-sn-glycerol-3-phosphate acyltransferase [Anaerolineae bacterium]|nr:1-acyl-sn-glycerol-3-phosphate acyltransferase [Gemmatimonadaceae bacterium]
MFNSPFRGFTDRAAKRALHRFRVRVNRFKLTRKPYIRATLLADSHIANAVSAHVLEHGVTESAAWHRVQEYVDEIVPYFNVLAYYRVGYGASRAFLNLLYRVSVEYEDLGALDSLPEESIVVYLANHRSNADYVLLAYVLVGDVSISYAVGEWARAFPLEYVFKSFGSYFIRRKYREPLYHAVLERYVQLITRNGVTQGIFPEGGLSRDGMLGPAKIGLLDYIIGVARDEPALADRMVIIPVAINYDRVLEDRSLLRELDSRLRGAPAPRRTQFLEVSRYLFWNLGRLVAGRWRRYGRAAVTIGAPISLTGWLAEQRSRHGDLWRISRPERLAEVRGLANEVMSRIGALIPVTPVALACAAIQSLGGDFISRDDLLGRMAEMRDVLLELNARVLRADQNISETFERAWRMLSMRKILVGVGSGYLVLPRQKELVSYYANSIAHLLGPFADGVRERDTLPALAFLQSGK